MEYRIIHIESKFQKFYFLRDETFFIRFRFNILSFGVKFVSFSQPTEKQLSSTFNMCQATSSPVFSFIESGPKRKPDWQKGRGINSLHAARKKGQQPLLV